MARRLRTVTLQKTGHVDTPRLFAEVEQVVPMTPTRRDLLVEIRATGINVVDTQIRQGIMTPPVEGVLGFDAAGVVVETGALVQNFKVGDAVYYAGQLDRPGSYASHQLVDERIVGHKPKSLTFAEAASIPLAGLTAWEGLFDKLKLHADSSGVLLVVGAPGGVGPMVIQLARALTDVSIIATVSSDEAAKWVRSFGAEAVVDSGEDFLEDIRRVAPGGVDYVFSTDSVGLASALVPVMNPFGEIVACDVTRQEDFDVLKHRSISWHWENVFARPIYGAIDMCRQHEALDEIARLVDNHRIRPPITGILAPVNVATIKEAHRRVESPRRMGKIVVVRGDVTSQGLYPRGTEPEWLR